MNIYKQLDNYDEFQKLTHDRWDCGSDEAEELIKRYGQDQFDLCYNSYKIGFMVGMEAAQYLAQHNNPFWCQNREKKHGTKIV